jgi:hypothetical protein
MAAQEDLRFASAITISWGLMFFLGELSNFPVGAV